MYLCSYILFHIHAHFRAALTDTNNVLTPFASIGSQTDGYGGGLCTQIPHGGSSWYV